MKHTTSFHYMNCEIIIFLLLKVNDKSEGENNKVYANMYVFQLCNQFHELKIRKKKSHGKLIQTIFSKISP